MVAISAADGYARATRKPQCVLVHVDVGTSALGQALHTASSGKAPMLIFAGQAPYTLYGELNGSRSEHVQWYQDVPNQASIVAPFSRYSNEIKSGEHVKMMVNRALLMASTGSCGPTYLTATREALTLPATDIDLSPKPKPKLRLGGLPADAVEEVGEGLLRAENPLVVTGYLGRNSLAVQRLVQLVEIVKGLRVFDFEYREMSFPAGHRAWLSRSTGGAAAIKGADVILVVDADVPWIPTKVRSSETARIFHVDVDPRKEKMQLYDIYAEASFNAEAHIALQQLCDFIGSHNARSARQDVFEQRWRDLGDAHAKGMEVLKERAAPRPDGSISSHHLFATLKMVVPKETYFVHDVVTNQVPFTEQAQAELPGTNLSKGSSGLGWGGGAAIGVRLALDKYDISQKPNLKPRERGDETQRLVCMVSGDGSFIFGVPSAVYWAQHRLDTPFLSIVVNNGGWKATRVCIGDVHPDGVAAKVTDEGLGIDLKRDGPDYVGIAVAASNGTLWGRKVVEASKLEGILREAVEVVLKEKKGAIVEVVIS
jgi:thiamine pyrophosphate-dependent acetolactate synthase large subunit-like protein